jgi:hypothetical protein
VAVAREYISRLVKVDTSVQAIISIRSYGVYFEKEVGQTTNEADDRADHANYKLASHRPTTEEKNRNCERNSSDSNSKFGIRDTNYNHQ